MREERKTMKAKLIVNGKEIEVEISEQDAQKLTKPKRTGYERVDNGETYYCEISDGKMFQNPENFTKVDDDRYNSGNYYSDRTIAENNARADTLMRQLRRFAVEHREKRPNWNCPTTPKWTISFKHDGPGLCVTSVFPQHFGGVYFGTVGEAKAAIEAFRDELIWYFAEYRDSL